MICEYAGRQLGSHADDDHHDGGGGDDDNEQKGSEVESKATHVNEIAQLITSIQSNEIVFPMSNDAHTHINSNGVMYLAELCSLCSWL